LNDVSLGLKRGVIGEKSCHTLGVSAIKGVSVERLESKHNGINFCVGKPRLLALRILHNGRGGNTNENRGQTKNE
jgi:hypothetical protein